MIPKFDKLVGLLISFEQERNEDQQPPVKGIAFTASSEDERVKKLEADVSLMVRSFNNMVKRLDKGVSRILGRFNRGENQWNSRTNEEPSCLNSSQLLKTIPTCTMFGLSVHFPTF